MWAHSALTSTERRPDRGGTEADSQVLVSLASTEQKELL